jgi:hypothetical protein
MIAIWISCIFFRFRHQDDQDVSFGKIDGETYAYVYEAQKWYVDWVVSLGCIEYESTGEYQDYCKSRLEYDTLKCNENA